MSKKLITPSFSPAWKRVEEHYGAAFRFGRRAVEEAWHCGDALIAAKAETGHGEWLPALKAVGISHDAAKRLMLLRRKYSEIVQIALFDSVHAALTSGKPDTLPNLGETIRDPGPLFEQIDIFERFAKDLYADEDATYGEKVAYAHWTLKPGGDSGLNLAVIVGANISLYASKLCAICESFREGKDCTEDYEELDTLHMAVFAGMNTYYKEAGKAMADSARFENWYPARVD